jgi:hypothetical protein
MRHVVAVGENSGQSLRSLVNAVAHAIPKVTVFVLMRGRPVARAAAGYGPESEPPIGPAAVSVSAVSVSAVSASGVSASAGSAMGRGLPGAGPRGAGAFDPGLDDSSGDCAGA